MPLESTLIWCVVAQRLFAGSPARLPCFFPYLPTFRSVDVSSFMVNGDYSSSAAGGSRLDAAW